MSESPRYIWFPATTVRELKARLNAASDDAILKVQGGGEHMTLDVVEPGATIGEAKAPDALLNEAHICPPICPE